MIGSDRIRDWRRFAGVFLIVSFVGSLLVLLFERVPAVARCRATTTPNTFLSFCASTDEYDHLAFAFGLEPGIHGALAAAKVVVLGNSRAQFAFSTRAVDQWSRARELTAYRLGFGAGYSTFSLKILRLAGARPKLLIVNADPFFSDRRSPFAIRIEEDGDRAWVGGLRMRFAASLVGFLCGRASPPLLCRGRESAIYRIRDDGAWSWRETFFPKAVATRIDETPGKRIDLPPVAAERARTFLQAVGVAPECTVMTAVPNSKGDAAAAATELSRAIGAPLVVPKVAGLRTLDGSHFDADSAERWSAAFLEDLEPILSRCLGP